MGGIYMINISKKVSDIVNSCTEGYFAIIDEEGYPKVAARSNIKPEGIWGGYFSSNVSGHLLQSIMKEPRTSVCFQKDGDNITLIGKSEIITDEETKKELWQDWFIDHYPEGVNDPEYGVVRFKTERVSLWVGGEVHKFSMEELKK